MEQWAEQMEAEAENMEDMEDQQEERMERMIMINGNGSGAKAKRTMKIKVPQDARLNLEVRHGEVKIGDATNLRADFSHSRFSAEHFSGRKKKVRAAYTPVRVQQWNYGELQMSYVDQCMLDKVRSIKLISNASDVSIAELQETGILSGTFGNLSILKLAPGFDILHITVENGELVLNIPDAAFDFGFNGAQSELEYPDAIKVKRVENYGSEQINGYYKSANNDANISIDAEFNDVVLK